MKYLNFLRITKIKTTPKICLEIMFDYTHFLFKHRTSFNDFKVITENETEQILYYETKIFNFLPWSPIRRFISIKKLMPEEKMFHQVYLDLTSKNVFFFKVSMINKDDNVEIINNLSIPVSNFIYFFRKPLLKLVNIKFDVMWNEDKEMLSQLYLNQDYKNVQCVPKTYNLENIYKKEFDKHFKNENKIDYFISI